MEESPSPIGRALRSATNPARRRKRPRSSHSEHSSPGGMEQGQGAVGSVSETAGPAPAVQPKWGRRKRLAGKLPTDEPWYRDEKVLLLLSEAIDRYGFQHEDVAAYLRRSGVPSCESISAADVASFVTDFRRTYCRPPEHSSARASSPAASRVDRKFSNLSNMADRWACLLSDLVGGASEKLSDLVTQLFVVQCFALAQQAKEYTGTKRSPDEMTPDYGAIYRYLGHVMSGVTSPPAPRLRSIDAYVLKRCVNRLLIDAKLLPDLDAKLEHLEELHRTLRHTEFPDAVTDETPDPASLVTPVLDSLRPRGVEPDDWTATPHPGSEEAQNKSRTSTRACTKRKNDEKDKLTKCSESETAEKPVVRLYGPVNVQEVNTSHGSEFRVGRSNFQCNVRLDKVNSFITLDPLALGSSAFSL